MKSRGELANIYELGISRTLWKSTLLDKLNQLRTAIDLPLKATALIKGQYDAEVVEILSGVAMYNTDPFSTWRTAFREVLKLRAENTEISKIRLEAWTSIANGNVAEYSIKGANDALQYYDEVNGDYNSLKLSYEWDWLRERFNESRLKMRDFFIK